MKRLPLRMKVQAGILMVGLIFLSGCEFAPSSPKVDFGEVYVGTKSKVIKINWVNQDTAKTGQFITLSTRAPFALLNPQDFASTQSVSPGSKTKDAQFQFSPTAAGGVDRRARPFTSGIGSKKAQLNGKGVWSKNKGALVLQNWPASHFMTGITPQAPISKDKPIDFGELIEGGSAKTSDFRISNTGTKRITSTLSYKLLNGGQHFKIIAPAIATGGSLKAGGSRGIQIQFNPVKKGTWQDILEVTDSANKKNLAGIVLKAKVKKGE